MKTTVNGMPQRPSESSSKTYAIPDSGMLPMDTTSSAASQAIVASGSLFRVSHHGIPVSNHLNVLIMKTRTLKLSVGTGALFLTMLMAACHSTQEAPPESEAGSDARSEAVADIAPADYASDPHLEVEVRKFLKILNSGGKPLESLPPEAAKQVLVDAQASVKVDLSGTEMTEKTITADGYTVKLNIVRPKGVSGKLPVFIFIHGGGWILGDYPTHERMVRDLVVRTGFASVFVNYTRTPEAQFPVAINEIYAATKWVSQHGDEINVDGSNLAVVGNSVGGNMTAVTALMAKEKNGPKIKGLVMMWPIVDADFDTESYKKFGKDRFLSTSLMKWMYDMYIPDPANRSVIYASPLRATSQQLSGLPPTLIITAENDVLRDEGEAFGRKLDEAGVKVATTRYDGMIHDFGLLNALATLPATKAAFDQSAGQLKEFLKK